MKNAAKNSTVQQELSSALENAEYPLIGGKMCSKCKKIKPMNTDFFYASNDKRNQFPFKSHCKVCAGSKGKRLNHLGNGYKICSKCKVKKPATKDFFGNQKNKIDNLRPDCKVCESMIKKAAYEKKPKEELKNKRKSYYEKNKEKMLKTQYLWNKRNKGKVRHYKRVRKQKLKRAITKWFEKDMVERVYHEASLRGWEVDHVVPLQSEKVCGLHCHDNLQILEKKLNRAKSNSVWPDMP